MWPKKWKKKKQEPLSIISAEEIEGINVNVGIKQWVINIYIFGNKKMRIKEKIKNEKERKTQK